MADIFDLFRRIEKKDEAQSAPISFIVAGLGNPGKEYEGTRHNVGFDAVSALAETMVVGRSFTTSSACVGPERATDFTFGFFISSAMISVIV